MKKYGYSCLISILVLLLCIGLSPYFTLYQINNALVNRSSDTLNRYINYPELNYNITKQVKRKIKIEPTSEWSTLLNKAINKTTAASIEHLITPNNIINILSHENNQYLYFGNKGSQEDESVQRQMRYTGVNEFRITFTKSDNNKFQVILKRSGIFSWQITDFTVLLDKIISE